MIVSVQTIIYGFIACIAGILAAWALYESDRSHGVGITSIIMVMMMITVYAALVL